MTVSFRAGPRLAIVGATVAVSLSAIFIRLAGDDPATIVWARMAMAATLLAPFAFRVRPRVDRARGRQPLLLILVSGILLAGHFLLWTASLQLTSIAASVLLVSMHPLLVTPLSLVLLRERTPLFAIGGMIIALAGVAVTCVGDLRLSGTAITGDLLALGGAVCLAGYVLIGRGVRASVGVARYSAVVYSVVAIVAAATVTAQGIAHLPSGRTAVYALALAVVCTLGGHTVYNWALRHVPALTVSVAFLGEAPLTSAFAVIVLATVPPLPTIIGGAIILVGLAMVVLAPSIRRAAPMVALE